MNSFPMIVRCALGQQSQQETYLIRTEAEEIIWGVERTLYGGFQESYLWALVSVKYA